MLRYYGVTVSGLSVNVLKKYFISQCKGESLQLYSVHTECYTLNTVATLKGRTDLGGGQVL